MDIYNSDYFHSKLDEMSERKASLYVIALVRGIAGSLDRGALTSKGIVSQGRALLEGHTQEDAEILEDPVVKAFLRQVQCSKNDVNELSSSCLIAASKTLGWAYNKLPSVGSGGSDLFAAIKNNSLSPFSNFVSKVCRVGLEKSIASAFKTLNFVDGGSEVDLYGIDLGVNFITAYEEQYQCYFTGDDICRDVLVTHDVNSLLAYIPAALNFELSKLESIQHDDENSMRNTHMFNSVIITRNGVEIVKIPLQVDGYDQAVDPNAYDLKFRRNVNSDPISNYQVDLLSIEVLDASAKELRIFAKSLPRQAALRLRGMSVEQDLGM